MQFGQVFHEEGNVILVAVSVPQNEANLNNQLIVMLEKCDVRKKKRGDLFDTQW